MKSGDSSSFYQLQLLRRSKLSTISFGSSNQTKQRTSKRLEEFTKTEVKMPSPVGNTVVTPSSQYWKTTNLNLHRSFQTTGTIKASVENLELNNEVSWCTIAAEKPAISRTLQSSIIWSSPRSTSTRKSSV